MNKINSILIAVFIYVFIQGTALWISSGGYGIEKGVIEKIDKGEIKAVTENPQDPYSAIYLFIMILVATGLLLLLLKYGLDKIIKIMMLSGFMVGLYFTFSNIFNPVIGLTAALLLTMLYAVKRDSIWVMDSILLFVIPGIGSILGASLSIIPAMIFIIVMSVYDIIAVFGTKHMVKLANLANESESNIPLMFAIPAEDRCLALGTGDMALPVVFTVALLRDYPIEYSVVTAAGGLIGLVFMLAYILNRKGLVLPALPPIAVGLLLGFVASILIL
ncbi:MAG: presenilin family intramembrane aspartyl protease [Candidatus Altiarchaeota archaeon]|nr:presenilin family intramembrane aspartyl protease [Candidatus Altiarchaeota archaeon]